MTRSLVAAALAFSVLGASSAAFAEKKVVAVLPFASPNKHNLAEMGRNAQPTFITALIKTRKVRVVNEKRIKGAVKRFEREMTGLFDEKKIRQIGRFLKADYVVSGQLSYTGDAYTMTVHVTNIETLEIEMAEDVDFRKVNKLRVAVRTMAKKIAALVSGEGAMKGKHEAFLNIDARHFYDTAEATINALKGLDAWRYEGEIDSEDPSKKRVHVMMKRGTPREGMPLQVFEEGVGENDRPIGVVYVIENDESGGGFIAKYIKEKDKGKKKRGDFGLGARVSNARYKYRIAIGNIDDLAEDNVELVTMFKEKLEEKLAEEKNFKAMTSSKVRMAAAEKSFKTLHKRGVDFLVTGKFIGSPGQRRADFKVYSTVTGEVWGTLKFETRI